MADDNTTLIRYFQTSSQFFIGSEMATNAILISTVIY